MTIKMLDVVRLLDGRKGAVVEVFDDGKAFMIEITDENGKTIDMPIVTEDKIKEILNTY